MCFENQAAIIAAWFSITAIIAARKSELMEKRCNKGIYRFGIYIALYSRKYFERRAVMPHLVNVKAEATIDDPTKGLLLKKEGRENVG